MTSPGRARSTAVWAEGSGRSGVPSGESVVDSGLMCQSLAEAGAKGLRVRTARRRVVESRFTEDATGLGASSCGYGERLGADVDLAAFADGIEEPDDVA